MITTGVIVDVSFTFSFQLDTESSPSIIMWKSSERKGKGKRRNRTYVIAGRFSDYFSMTPNNLNKRLVQCLQVYSPYSHIFQSEAATALSLNK